MSTVRLKLAWVIYSRMRETFQKSTGFGTRKRSGDVPFGVNCTGSVHRGGSISKSSIVAAVGRDAIFRTKTFR